MGRDAGTHHALRHPMTLDLPAYGSDPSGLVCGYRFGPDGAGRAIGSSEALAWLRLDDSEKGTDFVWLHFALTNTASEKWLRESLTLPDEFLESLHEGSRSTRIEYAEGRLVAVVNDALYDFSFAASDIAAMWLCVDGHAVISARVKPLRSVDRLRASVNKGERFASSVELLNHLFHDQCDVLVQIVRKAIATVDRIEDSLLAGRLEIGPVDLGALRRVLVRLRRLLAPEPAALFRLLGHPPDWIGALDLQELRRSTEEFAVVLDDMAALLERIKLLQEEVAAQVNEQNNRSLFLLTIFTVLALPINIIAGLLGMNVGGVPLAQHENGFWIVVGIVATFTLPAVWLVFRRQRK
jgi:zinc transporter